MSTAPWLMVATSLLLSVGSTVSTLPATFKTPPDTSVIEVVRGGWETVTFRLLYLYDYADEDAMTYQMRLSYNSRDLNPAVKMQGNTFFNLSVTTCPSESGVICSDMECQIYGDIRLDNMRVQQVVYIFTPLPFKDTETETQFYTIRIIDPPTTSEPTDTVDPTVVQTSTRTPPGITQPPVSKISADQFEGTALIGSFLGAALVISFIGYFVSLTILCKELRNQDHEVKRLRDHEVKRLGDHEVEGLVAVQLLKLVPGDNELQKVSDLSIADN